MTRLYILNDNLEFANSSKFGPQKVVPFQALAALIILLQLNIIKGIFTNDSITSVNGDADNDLSGRFYDSGTINNIQ